MQTKIPLNQRNTIAGTKQTGLWMLAVVLLFGLVYFCSLTFVFVDGDDATSIAYHLLGRNPSIQPPYSSYQGMMDKIISLIPADPILLKYIPLGITSLSAVIMVILILMLVFDWGRLGSRSNTFAVFVAIAVLLSIPELFFFGLVYLPTVLAMCLVLTAHLLLRWGNTGTAEPNRRIATFVTSLILFGFGTSVRWNVGAYAIVIAVDLWINDWQRQELASRRFLLAIAWGILAFLSSVMMIWLSGYSFAGLLDSFNTIRRVINQAGTLTSTADAGWGEILVRIALTISPLLTPATVVFSILGFIVLIRKHDRSWVVVLIGLLCVLPWFKSGAPKYLILSLPGLIYCYVIGFVYALDYMSQHRLKILQYIVICALVVIPWIIGVRVTRVGSAWGPSFVLRSYDYQESTGLKVGFAFGSGAAFPVPGGIRPLYGYGYVLLRGEWKAMALNTDLERQEALRSAMSLGVPLLVTSWSPDYYLYYLYAMGYKTTDPVDKLSEDGYLSERRFEISNGEQLIMLSTEVQGEEIVDLVNRLPSLSVAGSKVVLVGYPKAMRALYEQFPDKLTKVGSVSAILETPSP